MIQIYKENNKNYDKAGDMILDCISCFFTPKLNGRWELVLEHGYDDEGRWKYLIEKAVVRFPTPTRTDDLFRIYEVIKNDDTITAYAQPLHYDLKKKVILDKNIVDKDGQGAIDRILEDVDFIGHSNIKDVTNIRLVRKSIYDALLGDEDNTFASRLGGELYTNKKDIWINYSIGRDNNVEATFGYNLKHIEEKINNDNLYTRLYPEIFNGHTFDCVDSDKIDLYSDVYEGFVKFDDIKLEEDATEEEKQNKEYYTLEKAKTEVISRCKKIFENGADIPTKTYTLSISNMKGLDEYKEYSMVLDLDLGDVITVKDKILSSTVKARVIEFTWDCLTQEYTELVIGTEESDLFQSVSDATSYLNNILTSNKKISGASIQGIINALNVQFKAQYDIAEKVHTRAILFEDLDPESNTFGALCIGTKGLEISNKRNAQDTDWEWGTFITAGIVSADFIRTGLLSNIDGSFQIDLGKKGGAKFYINNNESMEIKQDRIAFYDNEGTRIIGGLFSLQRAKDSTQKSMVLGHRDNSFLDIDYYNNEDGKYYPYIQFDKYNVDDKYLYPISVLERTDFFERVCFYYAVEHRTPINFYVDNGATKVGTILGAKDTKNLVIGCEGLNNLCLCYEKDNSYRNAIKIHRDDNANGGCYVDHWGENVFKNSTQTYGYAKYYNGDKETGRIFGGTNNNMVVTCNYDNKLCLSYEKDGKYYPSLEIHRDDNANGGSFIDLYGTTTIYSDLTVKGTKNRAVDTENYGTRLLNAYETAECYFGDIGESNTGDTCKVKIELDPVFLETVNTKLPYHVFLSKYNKGDIWVSERTETYFIVESDVENLEFSFEIKAKQKDYANTRLEEFKENSSTNIVAIADNKENIIETSKEGGLND